MPYIKKEDRETLAKGEEVQTCGDLNYKIHELIEQHLDNNRYRLGYSLYNEVIGVLACVQQEFYRRSVVPYENKKINENGDIGLYEKYGE